MSTTTRPERTHNPTAPACVSFAEIFQNPLLEDASPSSHRDRMRQAALASQAERVCLDCPLMTRCLYAAVVEHDVAGHVAGTTEAQRRAMRRVLGIRVEGEDFGAFAGVREANRRITTDEVLRVRAAHPDDSLPDLAVRMGCSLSTVKRHLRAHRSTTPGPQLSAVRPTMTAVLAAWRRVRTVGGTRLAA